MTDCPADPGVGANPTAQVVYLYAKGYSQRQIPDAMRARGVPLTLYEVRRRLRAARVQMRPRGAPSRAAVGDDAGG